MGGGTWTAPAVWWIICSVAQQGDVVSLEGSVERVTFYNPESGFTVVKLRLRGRREPVAVVGTLPAVQPGEVLALTGRWHTDPVHGAQFQPQGVTVHPPAALGDIVRYLGSGLVRHLGPVLARRIVDAFGERTLEVLDAQPERVREVPGIGPQRAASIAGAWVEHRALRAVAAFLAEHGLDTRYAPRLVAAYGRDAPRVLGANPYRLVAEVPGLGFAVADRLGRDLGVRATATVRLQAAVHAALLRAAEKGHTRLTREALVRQAADLAGTGTDPGAGPPAGGLPAEIALLEGAVTQLLAGGVIAAGAPGRSAGGLRETRDGSNGRYDTAGQGASPPLPLFASGPEGLPAPAVAAGATGPDRPGGGNEAASGGMGRGGHSLAGGPSRLRIYEPRVFSAAVADGTTGDGSTGDRSTGDGPERG